MRTFNCDECSKNYSRKEKLLQHREKEHNTKYEKVADYKCGQCKRKFTQSRNLIQHLKTVHGCQTYTKCKHCTQMYGDPSCDNMKKTLMVLTQWFQRKLKARLRVRKQNTRSKNFSSPSGYTRTTKMMCLILLQSIWKT